MSEMIGRSKIDSQNYRNNRYKIKQSSLHTTTIQAIQTHRNEGYTYKRPLIHDSRSTDQQAEEVIVASHPHAVGKEDRNHGQRGVHEACTGGVHPGREEEEEVETHEGGMSEKLSHSSYEKRLSKRTEERQQTTDRVEHHHFISLKKPRHHFREEGKRNENSVRTKSILCTTKSNTYNMLRTYIPMSVDQS